jgi:HEAT repeat protein
MSMDLESVKALLIDRDFGQRIRGLNALRALEPAIAFELILPLVTDPHVRVRYAAVSQLANLGSQDRDLSLKLLRVALRDPETDIQAAAADAIGALQLTDAFDELASLYRSSPDWIVRMSILAPLGEFGDPRAFDLLVEALRDDNPLMYATAISALGEMRDSRAVPHLAPFADDPDWQTRYRLVQALSYLEGNDAQNLLKRLAQDPNSQVAEEAQRSLR